MKKELWFVRDFSVNSRRILVRVDFNVPITKDGKVRDSSKIRAALPTIKYLLEKKARIILLSHLGNPNGFNKGLCMNRVAKVLQKLLKRRVSKLDDCVGDTVSSAVKNMGEGEIILLENVRFHPEEKNNDELLARELASLGELYINDAFGTMHRSQASVDAITNFLPSCVGLLVEKELAVLNKLLTTPERPFVAIMGGVKVSDKIKIIKNLLKKVDTLLIGGAMMFTFLKSRNKRVGKSLVENDMLTYAKSLLENKKIVLPVDVVAARSADAQAKTVPVKKIPQNYVGLDIGPKTVTMFIDNLSNAKTIFWNGPLGMVEKKKFSKGTEKIAKAIGTMKVAKVVGGGDIVAVIERLRLTKKFTHVSTGGGATLEFLGGKELPGLTALKRSFIKFSKYKMDGVV